MKVIIIGAGRGRRLEPHTNDRPKCQVEIAGIPILDWILAAFRAVGLNDFVFIGGYRIDYVRGRYPELAFVENPEWASNNILLSLFCAERHMEGGFYCAYADTLLSAPLLRPLVTAQSDITLSVDTSWNERHMSRPEAYDAQVEAAYVAGDRVTRLQRVIPPADGFGEFTGVTRFTPEGALRWRRAFHRARLGHAGRPFHHAATFETAYLVDLFQEMIDQGEPVGYAANHGGYVEVDTRQDYELANLRWPEEMRSGERAE